MRPHKDVERVACYLTANAPSGDDERDAETSEIELFWESKHSGMSKKLFEISPNILIGHQGVPNIEKEMRNLKDLLEAKDIKCQTIYVLHVYSFAQETSKQGKGASTKADNKEQEQIRLIKDADVVAAVGPDLYRLWSPKVRGKEKCVKLMPGLSDRKTSTEEGSRTVNEMRRVLFMSRLGNEGAKKIKGLDVALQAMSYYSELIDDIPNQHKVQFAVRGFASEDVEEFTKDANKLIRGKKVTVEAKVFNPNEEIVGNEVEAADVLLMPSQHEGFGLVALEALSVETPVICSSNSGFATMLREIRSKKYTGDKEKEGEFIESWIVSPDEDKDAFARKVFARLWAMLCTHVLTNQERPLSKMFGNLEKIGKNRTPG